VTPRELLRSKIVAPILEQLTQGLAADTIALTIGVGLAIAVIPVIGVTTILSLLAAWAFRLNQPIMQAINWTTYPLQLLLLFPFIRLGERLFQAPRLSLSLEELVAMGRTDPVGTFTRLGATAAHAVVAWGVFVPFIILGAYYASRPILRVLARRATPTPRISPGGSIDDLG
jgi:uncharacterized protein (DUF2062 family)